MAGAVHIKTGNIYTIEGEAIDATNGSPTEGKNMIIYSRDGKQFVREAFEFFEKFSPIKEERCTRIK